MPATDPPWERVASLISMSAAHELSELLQAELVPTRVVPASLAAGDPSQWDVRVPADQVSTARRLMASSWVTEAELSYLVTGKLDDAQDRK